MPSSIHSDTPAHLKRLLESSPALKTAIEIVQFEVSRLTSDEQKAAELLTELLGLHNVRPSGWSPNSNATYYKKKYGDLLLSWLDQFKNAPDKMFIIETKKIKRSRETIRTMVSQAWDWLISNEKESEKRAELIHLRDSIKIDRHAYGVMFVWRHTADETQNFVTKLVKDTRALGIEDVKKWKQEVMDFTEKANDGQKYVNDGIILEPFDLDWLQNYIKESQCLFPLKIHTTRIEIVKHTELWKQMNVDKSE